MTQFEEDIIESKSIFQLLIKSELVVGDNNPKMLFDYIISNFLYISETMSSVNSDIDTDKKSVMEKILVLLEKIPDDFKEYICNKNLVSHITELICGDYSYGFRPPVKYLIGLCKVINKHDPELFRSLRTSDGSNILMYVLKEKKIDVFMGCCTKMMGNDNRIDELTLSFLKSNPEVYKFIYFLINDACVDVNGKDDKGKCFTDFIPKETIEKFEVFY